MGIILQQNLGFGRIVEKIYYVILMMIIALKTFKVTMFQMRERMMVFGMNGQMEILPIKKLLQIILVHMARKYFLSIQIGYIKLVHVWE